MNKGSVNPVFMQVSVLSRIRRYLMTESRNPFLAVFLPEVRMRRKSRVLLDGGMIR